MADIAVENKETPIVEKDIEETESLKKIDAAEDLAEPAAVAENGNADEEKRENGDAVAKPTAEEAPESVEDEHSNGDKKDDEEDDVEETNGDSTDAPEAVKRKVEESKADETSATPEKKAKLDEAAVEKEVNGAEATELAAEA